MAKRVVDPNLFISAGAVIDWAKSPGTHHPERALEMAKHRELDTTRVLQLRWAFDAVLGYPVEPFTVWSRPHAEPDSTVPFELMGTTLTLSGAWPCVYVQITAGPGGLALAWAGAVLSGPIVGIAVVTTGATTVRISGPGIRTISLPAGTQVAQVFSFNAVADDPAWEPIEIVGLPGDGRVANNTDLTAPQGLVSALGPPEQAALDRFWRGAPFTGWPGVLPSGQGVPAWSLANPIAMLKLFWSEMLDDFVDMVDTAAVSSDQQNKAYQRSLLTPQGQSAEATFNPLKLVLYGGASDPLASLVLGLGTAYPLHRSTEFASVAVSAWGANVGADFMITGVFRSAAGTLVERATFVFAPGAVAPPPTPAALSAASEGVLPPVSLDDPFRPVVSVSWDAPPALFSFFVGSHGFARWATQPGTGVAMLLDPRPMDTALQPRGASRNAADPDRRTMSDSEWRIVSTVTPNQLRYAVASQDIFGLWSAWNEIPAAVSEPAVGPVTLTGARLDTQVAPGPCPASITVDLTWNWSSRSPQTITLVGRRFPQTWPGDPPTNTTPPTINTYLTTGAGLLVTITFQPDGSISALTAGTGMTALVQHLTVDGQQVSAVPITQRDARRYRVRVTNSTLDFDSSGRWGIALWARGVERRPPNRTGNWNTQPVVASAADPRPPVITKTYDAVILASMRDSQGLHHAHVEWNTAPGAVAYQVYTCSEATFRAHHAMPEPSPAATLQQRVTQLRNKFEENPDRRPFTRVSTDPVTSTSLQVTLPRGTKEIHLYVVLGVSAGNVESAWPALGDPQLRNRFVAFAAPQAIAPGAPQLEVSRDVDATTSPVTYRAKVRLRTSPGAQVSRVELFRVRVPGAAAQIDTMGPPAHTFTGSAGGFTVTPTPPGDPTNPAEAGIGQAIGTITGVDAVPGSWKPLYYRAVAWGADDDARGQYGVRSAPSVVREVVIPPPDPPDLTPPTVVLPIINSAIARLDFATAAPVADTVLGPHRLEAEVLTVAATGTTTVMPLDVGSATLADLPTAAPASPDSGLWRDSTSSGSTPLHLLVRRTDKDLSLRVRLRITDPIGRITERVLEVPPGANTVVPDLNNIVITKLPKGWALSFQTSVPTTVDGNDVELLAAFRPGVPGGRRASVTMPMRSIPPPPPARRPLRPFDPFADTTNPIPVFATRRSSGTREVAVCVRAAGTLQVTLRVPGGESATITRAIA